jgi:hypothetical protein
MVGLIFPTEQIGGMPKSAENRGQARPAADRDNPRLPVLMRTNDGHQRPCGLGCHREHVEPLGQRVCPPNQCRIRDKWFQKAEKTAGEMNKGLLFVPFPETGSRFPRPDGFGRCHG